MVFDEQKETNERTKQYVKQKCIPSFFIDVTQ